MGDEFVAMVTDKDDEPFTRERFICEPGAAESFLELIESNSVGVLRDWRNWSNDQIQDFASKRLSEITKDLTQVHYMKLKGKLQ